MTILSTAGTIHCLQYYLFVYQTLRVFNMLTKSKISEALGSDVEDIVTMLSNEVAIHSCFQISKKFVNMLSIEDAMHTYLNTL